MKRTAASCILLLLLLLNIVSAQTTGSPVETQLCREWRLVEILQAGGAAGKTEPGEFVLILKEDHTVQQGMMPDALIKGGWELDAMRMKLLITDAATKKLYQVRIVRITSGELVLEDESATPVIQLRYESR